ncbi:MAG: MMPL family transporter [Thermoleophilaceae bacterium]
MRRVRWLLAGLALASAAVWRARRRAAPGPAPARPASARATPPPPAAPPAPPARLSTARRAAGLIVALRWPIVAAWVAAAVAVTLALPTIREAQVGALGDLVPGDSEAIEAEIRSAELFGFPVLSRTVVVQRDPDGLSARAQARVFERVVGLNRGTYPGLDGIPGALAVNNVFGEPPFSRERSTTALTYLFFPTDIGPVGRAGLAERLIERRMEPEDSPVGVTGTLQARAEQSDLITERLPLVELVTALLVIGAVGLHFRSLGAPLLNAIAVALAYLVSIRTVAAIGEQLGVSVPSEVEPVMVVLLFGVLTDYSIFFLSRFRERLAEPGGARAAAADTIAELLPIVLAAGLTVILASGALIVAELGFLRAFGPGLALSMLVALLVAITFVPAALAIVGERLFWPRGPEPRRTRRRSERPPLPLRLVGRAPVAVAVACLVVLLAGASGLTRTDLGNPLIRGLPDSSDTKQAYLAASEGFAPGILAPTVIVVEAEGIARRRAELAELQRLIALQQGVAEVAGPADQPVNIALGGALSRTGDGARYVVVFGSDPLGSRAINRLTALRGRLPGLLGAAGLGAARFSVGGDTALSEEIVTGTVDDLGRVAPATMLAVFLVLAVFLRALVAPLYLLASSVLGLLAALGLATYLFQDVLGYGELTYFVPFAAAVLLVALGSDYNVFLVGRVWREARDVPLRDAVMTGAADAARPIAVAGLVLAGSFALLALVPVRAFGELAFTMALGLLLDAFLVRTLLVPALILIAGRASGWPGPRLRRRPGAQQQRSQARSLSYGS